MTRRTQLNNFLDLIYKPVGLTGEIAQLRRIISENDYREIREDDTGKMFKNCLIIETAGRGLRETYKAFYIARVDIGNVGAEMADIAIYYNGSDFPATPRRVGRKNIKINIPEF